jgi:hypothetical protein
MRGGGDKGRRWVVDNGWLDIVLTDYDKYVLSI